MKSIKVRGIKKLGKKLQASIRGGTCSYTLGDETFKCIEYNVTIVQPGDGESASDADTATELHRIIVAGDA